MINTTGQFLTLNKDVCISTLESQDVRRLITGSQDRRQILSTLVTWPARHIDPYYQVFLRHIRAHLVLAHSTLIRSIALLRGNHVKGSVALFK